MSTSVDLNAPPLLPGVVSYHAVPDGPLSNVPASIVPGSGAGDPGHGPDAGGGGGASAFTKSMRPKLPTTAPAASKTSRATCCPAVSDIAAVTVCQFCHPRVFGTVSGPVTLAPFISRWNVPP